MTPNQQSGLSLIEVLVAVAVFAFGLLAIAALMANGMRMSTSSMHRSFAINQAYDMADRIRANPSANYDGILDGATGPESNKDPACITDAAGGGCSKEQMMGYDQYHWNTQNADFLPSGEGSVEKTGDIYRITVRWDDTRGGVTGRGCDPKEPDDMTCFQFEFQP